MLNKKTLKVLIITALFLLIMIGSCQAKTIYSTDKQVNGGQDVTITVTSSTPLGAYKLVVTDTAGLTLKSTTASGMQISSDKKTIQGASDSGITTLGTFTFSTSEVSTTTTYNIKFTVTGMETPDLQSIANETNTATITVKAKEVAQQPTTPSNTETNTETEKTTEPTFVSVSKKVYAKDDINLRESWSTSSAKVEVKKDTELDLTGTSKETVNGYVWYRVKYNGKTMYVASQLVTETKPAGTAEEEKKSTNANLKELSITPGTLEPKFSKDVKEYTLTVKSDVTEVKVIGTAEDEKSTVKVDGDLVLKKDGDSIVTVSVKSEDGKTENTYKIKVVKETKSKLALNKIEATGFDLKVDSKDAYKYTVNVGLDVESLDLKLDANDPKAIIEVIGNLNFKDGENIVTIILKSEDGSETATYQVVVNKAEIVEEKNEESKSFLDNINLDIVLYAVVGLIILIVIIIIITAIVKKKKSKKEDSGEYFTGLYNQENDSDYEEPQTKGRKKGKHF